MINTITPTGMLTAIAIVDCAVLKEAGGSEMVLVPVSETTAAVVREREGVMNTELVERVLEAPMAERNEDIKYETDVEDTEA